METLIKALRSPDDSVFQQINAMTHDERRALREAATAAGVLELPRNLFFDYQAQVWID